jgi:hypothetical protein
LIPMNENENKVFNKTVVNWESTNYLNTSRNY